MYTIQIYNKGGALTVDVDGALTIMATVVYAHRNRIVDRRKKYSRPLFIEDESA